MSQNLQMNIEKKETPTITVQLLQNVRSLIDCAIKRGAYLPQELSAVGIVYEKFSSGLDNLQNQLNAQNANNAEENITESNSNPSNISTESEPTTDATTEPTTEPTTESTNEGTTEATTESTIDATNESTNEDTNESTNEDTTEATTDASNVTTNSTVYVEHNQESTSQVDVVKEALATVSVSREAEV